MLIDDDANEEICMPTVCMVREIRSHMIYGGVVCDQSKLSMNDEGRISERAPA